MINFKNEQKSYWIAAIFVFIFFSAVMGAVCQKRTVKKAEQTVYSQPSQSSCDFGEGAGGDDDEGVYDQTTALPAGVSLDKPAVSMSFCAPLSTGKNSSLFGYRVNPVSGKYKFHKGYDIAAPYGEKIYSVADGQVSFVGWDKNGYGNYLVVTHSGGVKSLYAHCSKLLAKKGDNITAGQTIALVGSTGGSTGNHLHIEIEIDGIKYDPEWFFGGLYD